MSYSLVNVCERCGLRSEGPGLPIVDMARNLTLLAAMFSSGGRVDELADGCPGCRPELWSELPGFDWDAWRAAVARARGTRPA